ncbi:MAG: PIN domain-containing protein [Armatimonadetes bacterium]|jgi:hypothetical protein|nr:PIN domain-containing protein [Armatimonadota bacterium]
MSQLILIDFENIIPTDFKHIPEQARVLIFVGKQQGSIPFDLVCALQPLGTRVEWIKVRQSGENAADFILAYELGKYLTNNPTRHVTILTKDKGFDALAQHVTRGSRRCCRIESLTDLIAEPTPKTELPAKVAPPSGAEDILKVLLTYPKARPTKRKPLENFIGNRLKVAPEAVPPVIAELIQRQKLQIDEGTEKVTYHF